MVHHDELANSLRLFTYTVTTIPLVDALQVSGSSPSQAGKGLRS